MKTDDFSIYFRALSLVLCIIALSSCDERVSDASPTSINNTYSFPYEITSVNRCGDSLLLGTMSNHFIIFDPVNKNWECVTLPKNLNNIMTYYVERLSWGDYLVSKRNNGVVYVPADNADDARVLKQDSLNLPFKGRYYSSYVAYETGDTVFVGSTNGLLYTTKGLLQDGAKSLPFVESVRWRRDFVTQFVIKDIYKSNNEIIASTDSLTMFLDLGQNMAERKAEKSSFVHPDIDLHSALGVNLSNNHSIDSIGNIVFYVDKGKLSSLDNSLMDQLNNTSYLKLLYAAEGTDEMFFINKSGLYHYDGDSVKFMHKIRLSDKINDMICLDGMIYYITDKDLMQIKPKGKYSYGSIVPKKIRTIAYKNEDNLICLAAVDGALIVGSRDSLYRYDSDKDIIETYKITHEGYQNPYFTSISYPYVATLNQGIYMIDGDSVVSVNRCFREEIPEIRQIIANDNKVYCRTNNGVISLTVKSPKNLSVDSNERLSEIDAPMDIAIINGSLMVLNTDYLYNLSKDGALTIHRNQNFKQIAAVGQSVTLYGDYPMIGSLTEIGIIFHAPWVYDDVNWSIINLIVAVVMLCLVAGILAYILHLYVNKLNDAKANLTDIKAEIFYYANKKLILRLQDSKEYSLLLLNKDSSGHSTDLRNVYLKAIQQALDTMDSDREAFKENMGELLHLSRYICDAAAKIPNDCNKAIENLPQMFGTDEGRLQQYRNMLEPIREISCEFSSISSKKSKDDIILLTPSVIIRLEQIYDLISSAFNLNEMNLTVRNVLKNIADGGNEAEQYIAKLDSLILKYKDYVLGYYTGRKDGLMFNDYDDRALEVDVKDFKGLKSLDKNNKPFFIDALLLTSISDLAVDDVKDYLKWRYFDRPIERYNITSKAIIRELTEMHRGRIKYSLSDSSSKNNILNFLRNGLSPDFMNQQIKAPSCIFDLLYISTFRFFDKVSVVKG